jgi:hypothetical protein
MDIHADLSDEASSDVRTMAHGLAKSEGVRGLSPDEGFAEPWVPATKKRAALKE